MASLLLDSGQLLRTLRQQVNNQNEADLLELSDKFSEISKDYNSINQTAYIIDNEMNSEFNKDKYA